LKNRRVDKSHGRMGLRCSPSGIKMPNIIAENNRGRKNFFINQE
jgi:hypothetical protein